MVSSVIKAALPDEEQRSVAVHEHFIQAAGPHMQRQQHSATASDSVSNHGTIAPVMHYCPAALTARAQKAGLAYGGSRAQPANYFVPPALTPELAASPFHALGEETVSEDGTWATASTADGDAMMGGD